MMPTGLEKTAGAALPDTPAAFDFSSLGDLSEQAVEADRQFDLHYGTAQDEYLISCIYLAKVHALTARAGRYGGGTWTKWYESKGLGEGSVRRMIQNGEAFKSANMAELKQLPELTRKDLNLIARSGCAEQLTEAAGNRQKVQELIDRLRADVQAATERADAAEAERDKLVGVQNRAVWAEKHIQDAEAERDAALADVQGLAEANSRLNAEKEQALQRAAKAEEALKHQPIAGVVDKAEVKRQADEMARKAREQAALQVQEARRTTAEVQAEFERFRQAADGFLAPEQVCTQQAQLIANAVRAMYLKWFGQAVTAGVPVAQTGEPLYAVCGEIMTSLEEDTMIHPTAAGSEEDAEREALFE